MFDNIGKRIKTIATGACVLGMLGICVSVVMLVSASIDLFPNKQALISSGSYCAVVGLLLLLASFFVYGYGELVENSRIIARHLTRMDGQETPGRRDRAAAPDKEAGPSASAARDASTGRREARQRALRSEAKEDTWKCPECGAVHPAIRRVCWECGTPRPEEE